MTSGKEEETNNNGGVLDHTSPYYIHASDYPKQLPVNDILTDGYYNDWSQEMLNFLFAKNKVGFIDRTIKKPESNDPTCMAWMRCDVIILHNVMEKEIRKSVKYAASAQDIWADLKERFGKVSAPRAYELKQSLTKTKQEGASISTYFTKLRSLWDEIESVFPIPTCTFIGSTYGIGKKLFDFKQKERFYEFLLGLGTECGTIRTQILAMQPTPTLGAAYHMVYDDKQQKVVSGFRRIANDSAAFHAFVPKKRDLNMPNKIVQNDQKISAGNRLEHCDHCGKDGHNKDGCFKLVGYPE
ncbi:uncharacterized protein LOC143616670 [Bidens hawaiensis]|uniref:uncharacterized protein LOC143616670 n=1 Tax=Bidens hawaiensis TaxID=980011 RepID=UPI0040493B09